MAHPLCHGAVARAHGAAATDGQNAGRDRDACRSLHVRLLLTDASQKLSSTPLTRKGSARGGRVQSARPRSSGVGSSCRPLGWKDGLPVGGYARRPPHSASTPSDCRTSSSSGGVLNVRSRASTRSPAPRTPWPRRGRSRQFGRNPWRFPERPLNYAAGAEDATRGGWIGSGAARQDSVGSQGGFL